MIGILFVVLLLFFGQQEIVAERLTTAQFLAFIVFLFRSYDPMRKLSRLQNSLEQALAAAQHVWEVMDEHATIKEKTRASASPLKHEIELRNVSFGYENESRPVLRDANLRSSRDDGGAGWRVGRRKIDARSCCRVFTIRVPVRCFGTASIYAMSKLSNLRAQIALVTQETVLFNDTVRHNIAYGKPDATDAEVHEAATIALAHDFIREMPDGYDTIVGERGIFLSGGQRQRLAIARAILVNARAHSRRGHLGTRRRVGTSRAARDRESGPQSDDARHRSPSFDRSSCGRNRGDGSGPDHRNRNSHGTAGPRWTVPKAVRTTICR